MTRFISAFQFKKFGNWDWATNSIALLLAKWARARARPDAFASRTRRVAKDGRSVASCVGAIGSAEASCAETGRHGARFSRESGHWPPTTLSNIEKSVSAPRRLRAMFGWAPQGGEKQRDETVGRGLELGDERATGRRGCCRGEVASGALQSSLISEPRLFRNKTLESGIIEVYYGNFRVSGAACAFLRRADLRCDAFAQSREVDSRRVRAA